MAATVSIPLVVGIAQPAFPYLLLTGALAGLILVRHKNNIRRLRAGTEPRLGEHRSRTSQPLPPVPVPREEKGPLYA